MNIPQANVKQIMKNDTSGSDEQYLDFHNNIKACNLNKGNPAALSEDVFFQKRIVMKQNKPIRQLFLQQIEQNDDGQKISQQSKDNHNFVIASTKINSDLNLKKQGLLKLIDRLCGEVEFEIFIYNLNDETKVKVEQMVNSSTYLYINDSQTSTKLTQNQQKMIKNSQFLNIPNVEEEFIVKVYGQDENKVSQEIKWQIIQEKCLKSFKQKAFKSNVRIEPVPQKYQYLLVHNTNEEFDFKIYQEIKRFHQQFQEELQQIIILIYKCQNDEEANLISKILNDQVMKKLFEGQFQTKQLVIDSLCNIQGNQMIKLQSGIIFAIVFNYLDLPLKQLQESFTNIIQNDSFIKTKMSLLIRSRSKSFERINDKSQQKESNQIQQKEEKYSQYSQKCLQISIELLKQDKSKDSQNDLTKIINIMSGREDFEMKLQNPLENILIQLEQIIQQHPKELEFSQIRLNPVPKFIIQKIDKIYNKQNYKTIVLQINHENYNQILKEMKTIIFDWKFLPALQQKASQYCIDIDLDLHQFQYTLGYSKDSENQEINQFCTQFDQKLRNTKILIHQCSCKHEVFSIKQIFFERKMKMNLINAFNIQKGETMGISAFEDYPIDQIPKTLKEIIRKYYNQNLLIFTFMDFVDRSGTSIEQYQLSLNQLINDQIINYQDDSQIIHVEKLFDLTLIKFEIEKINSWHFQVQVLNPHFDRVQGKHYYQINYSIWMLKGKQDEFLRKLQNFKQQVANIMQPVVELVIDQDEQIQIWNKYLENHYKQKQIQVDKLQKNIRIKFLSDGENNQQNLEQMCKKLQSLQYSLFKFDLDPQIIQVLKTYLKSKLFDKEIQTIKEKQNIHYLQVIQIDEQKQQIVFESIFQEHSTRFVQTYIQDNLIQNIRILIINVQFDDILVFLQKSKEQYEQEYRCYIKQDQSQTTYVTMWQNVTDIQRSIAEYKYSKDKKIKVIQRQIQNKLLMESVKQMTSNKDYFDQKLSVSLREDENTIEIRGIEQLVNDNVQKLDDLLYASSTKLKSTNIQISSKFWQHLLKKHTQLIQDIEKKNQCIFERLENYSRAKIEFDNKVLLIRQGCISLEICDAIIINLSEQMDFKEQYTQILKLGGPQFENHIKAQVKDNKILKEGDIYNLSNPETIKNIISFSSNINYNVDQIKAQIQNLFKICVEHKLKSLAISITQSEQNNRQQFQQISKVMITELLIQIQNSQSVDSLVIIENKSIKVDILMNVLKEIIDPPEIRQIKYQWQWKDTNSWQDYNDYDINQQIDEAYDQYLINNSQNEIHIVFSFTKLPGTHIVDFKKMILTDIQTKQTQKISINKIQDRSLYLFNGQTIPEALNEHLVFQQSKNIVEFQIFFKRHKIVFQKEKIIQFNLATNYQREVRFQKYQKQQLLNNQQPLTQFKKFQFNEIKTNTDIQRDSQEQIILVIQSFEQINVNNAKKEIQDLVMQMTTIVRWPVINLNNYEYMQIKQEIQKRCLYFSGQIIHGQTIEIGSIKTKVEKLNDYLKKLEQKQIYPINWIPQDQNMITFELSKTDEEYKMVSKLFFETYIQGKIYQINRIQNKLLYENFNDEKQKLIKVRQVQGDQLTQIELERYVWHGVVGQHPKIIYQGFKNAFDITYSKDTNWWGPGIYFAQNSIYSKQYSYKLTNQDSQQNQGKLVFLLCLLATGKVTKQNANDTLKRPPDGCDCVQGNTKGSDIFVLYGMDVRRAYPAYEIIFE